MASFGERMSRAYWTMSMGMDRYKASTSSESCQRRGPRDDTGTQPRGLVRPTPPEMPTTAHHRPVAVEGDRGPPRRPEKEPTTTTNTTTTKKKGPPTAATRTTSKKIVKNKASMDLAGTEKELEDECSFLFLEM
ncbi:ORF42 [Ictalurid herpesvirus 1]|nr:ORF42 [Ictalurid herpesvirus 1]